MKTFSKFILEASNKYGIPDDEYRQWQRDRAAGRGPAKKTFNGVEYEMRSHARAGQPRPPGVWGVTPTSKRQESSEKRSKAEQETALSKDELLRATGDDEERAALASDTETSGIKKTIKRAQRIGKSTGVKQSLGHGQPLQPEEPSPEDPGHTRSNTRVEPHSPNTAKKNKRPEPGEFGYGLTRALATQDAVERGDTLGRKIDRERDLETPSRAARLLARLRRPKPKFKNSAERAKEQEARMTSAYDKRVDDALNA